MTITRRTSLGGRVARLVIGLTVALATIGCTVSFFLIRSVLSTSTDEALRVAVGHSHTSAADLAEELPSGGLVLFSDGRDVSVRAVGQPRTVSASDVAKLRPLLDGPSRLTSVSLPDRDDMRVAVVDKGDTRVLAAVSLEPIERDLARLAGMEVGLWFIAGVLGCIIGPWLARRVTRPLHAIERSARAIADAPAESVEQAVSQRVPHMPGATREIDAVANSVNALLGQVEGALARRDESETALRRLLADVSHELRTPIAVIRSHAELAGGIIDEHADVLRGLWPEPDDATSAQQAGLVHVRDRLQRLAPAGAQLRPSLDRIDRESRRMGRQVEDLMLLAHLDAGDKAERGPVDVTFLALETLSDAKLLAPEHRWAFVAPPTECEIIGDADGLRRVLTNLVTNAWRHTPAGTRIELGLQLDDVRGEPVVAVTVSDDGPGLPASVAANPGRRFKESGRADTSRRGGLGLAITVALVESMDGTIVFDSGDGGTTVTVTLPAGASQGRPDES